MIFRSYTYTYCYNINIINISLTHTLPCEVSEVVNEDAGDMRVEQRERDVSEPQGVVDQDIHEPCVQTEQRYQIAHHLGTDNGLSEPFGHGDGASVKFDPEQAEFGQLFRRHVVRECLLYGSKQTESKMLINTICQADKNSWTFQTMRNQGVRRELKPEVTYNWIRSGYIISQDLSDLTLEGKLKWDQILNHRIEM